MNSRRSGWPAARRGPRPIPSWAIRPRFISAIAVRHGERLLLVVRDVEHGHAHVAVDALDLELHLLAKIPVEGAQRLVHQEEPGVEYQGAGQSHPLLLPAGKLPRQAITEPCEVHHVERAPHLSLDRRFRLPAHLEGEGDVVEHRHVREERVVLKDDADVPVLGRHARDGAAVHRDLAGRGRREAGHHHQRRRLARATRAEEREELPTPDFEIDRVDGGRAGVALREAAERELSLADDVGHQLRTRDRERLKNMGSTVGRLRWCHAICSRDRCRRRARRTRRRAVATQQKAVG